MAGGTSTCETSTEKFFEPELLRPGTTAMALAGAVVSKPTAKKTTCRSGFFWASVDGIQRRIDDAHVAALRLAR